MKHILLRSLPLYTQLLSGQELSPEGRDCAAALEGQVEKQRALVDALVKTSRLEAGILALLGGSPPGPPRWRHCAIPKADSSAEVKR